MTRQWAIGLLAGAALLTFTASAAAAPGDWPMFNHDAVGTRANHSERVLTTTSARKLHVAWRYSSLGGPVYGTPAVVGDTVYAADVLGFVFALDAANGRVRWSTHIPTVVLPFPLQVTSSPLVTEHNVIIGDLNGTAWALDRKSGRVRWSARPNGAAFPAMWGSPTEIVARRADGTKRHLVIFPLSSNEETFTPTEFQPCCWARGSLAALDPDTGRLVWQAYTINKDDLQRGAAGATIWSSPTFDAKLNLVYATTGNNFGNLDNSPTTETSDAFIAVDAATGVIRWTSQRTENDTFTTAFHPSAEHPDFDFGDSPNLMKLPNGRRVLVAGQKSGVLYAVDAKSGKLLGLKQFLPSGGYGGLFADSATSGGTIFANGNDWPNFGGGEFGAVAGAITDELPPKSGQVIAVRPDRKGNLHERWRLVVPGTPMMTGVATANGVVYAHASRKGILYALDAKSGAHLAEVNVGPAASGPSISHGRVFMGWGDLVNLGALDPLHGGVVALAP